MTAKEILTKIKAAFLGEAPAASTDTIATLPFKTKEGVDIVVTPKDPAATAPAVGDTVTIGGIAATEGALNLEDGSVLNVDATGVITSITPAVEMAAPPAPAAPAAATPPVTTHMAATPKTAEEITKLYESFADGITDPANMNTVLKALMEYCFGWQIQEQQRKATADAAIKIYTEGLTTAQNTVTTATAAMAEQQKVIARHEETIKGMFELCEALVKEPTIEPQTLTGNKKEAFDRRVKKDEKFQGILDSLPLLNNVAKY